MKILTASEIRRVEEDSIRAGISTSTLMDNAGRAVAGEVRKILGSVNERSILFLIGPGNNGGDGLVAARYLYNWGAKVNLYIFGEKSPDDIRLALARERGIGATFTKEDKGLKKLTSLLSETNAAIDAVFGTGMNRPLEGFYREALLRLNESKMRRPELRIIALDLPTGLDADTGAVDPATPYADNTVTLGFPKPGLFNLPGAERAGKIIVVDIGIPAKFAESITDEYIEKADMRPLLPKRPSLANKGDFGRILVVAGSERYLGAPYLACSAAMRTGAGLTTLAIGKSLVSIPATKLTETTFLPLPEFEPGLISPKALDIILKEIPGYDVVLIGSGLGTGKEVQNFTESLLPELNKARKKLVFDADALNALAKIPEWWQKLTVDAILTPHPGEMARLTGLTVDEIQTNRLGISKEMASKWHKTIVLKGAYTVIAAPDGRVRVSPFTNPGLASAGTGDVLAGVVSGLLGQGLTLFDAATLGVYLHGLTGETVRENLGDTGMVASDLLPELPLTIKKLREG